MKRSGELAARDRELTMVSVSGRGPESKCKNLVFAVLDVCGTEHDMRLGCSRWYECWSYGVSTQIYCRYVARSLRPHGRVPAGAERREGGVLRCVGAWLRLDPSGSGGGLLSPAELGRSQASPIPCSQYSHSTSAYLGFIRAPCGLNSKRAPCCACTAPLIGLAPE